MTILPREFYHRDTVRVAKDLLGKTLVRKINNIRISGIITETEAYRFTDDPASHAYRGQTERNQAMFGEVGKAYVYFTYGMHYCVNAVARNSRFAAGAVLIRSIKPIEGIRVMKKNRKKDDEANLVNGPAKLTQALQITKELYGEDLTKRSSLFIEDGFYPKNIMETPRIGIKEGTDRLWNFKINASE